MTEKKEWWYPKPVIAETVQRLRDDYPEDTEGLDDEEVLEKYELEGCRYQWLWDHTGEAAEQADKLADEIFRLRELVKQAYREGVSDGRFDSSACLSWEYQWENSESKTALG